MDIFGVHLDHLSYAEVERKILKGIKEGDTLRIATVNPEFLLLAEENDRFKESLKNANIRTVDGAGIVVLSKIFGSTLPRVTGADLTKLLLNLAHAQNIPVVVYNQPSSLSSNELIAAVLQKHYRGLRISFNKEPEEYSVVLCTYGAPLQEFLLDTIVAPGVFMGVGGSIDYLTGTQKRAPRWAQRCGLEWIFRFYYQPKRIHRIWRAVVVFPLHFLKEKMVH